MGIYTPYIHTCSKMYVWESARRKSETITVIFDSMDKDKQRWLDREFYVAWWIAYIGIVKDMDMAVQGG